MSYTCLQLDCSFKIWLLPKVRVSICYTRKQISVRKTSLEICIHIIQTHKQQYLKGTWRSDKRGNCLWAGGTMSSKLSILPSPASPNFATYSCPLTRGFSYPHLVNHNLEAAECLLIYHPKVSSSLTLGSQHPCRHVSQYIGILSSQIITRRRVSTVQYSTLRYLGTENPIVT